jgi:hypothetical protein
MPTEDEMSVNERRKYLKRMKVRYITAKRGERGHLLTEMEQVTSLHRKSLTCLMHTSSLERKKRVTPRARSCGQEVERIIVCVWERRDYICAEPLTPGLLPVTQHLTRFEPVGLSAPGQEQLATTPGTITVSPGGPSPAVPLSQGPCRLPGRSRSSTPRVRFSVQGVLALRQF